jgi:hypothetical protein
MSLNIHGFEPWSFQYLDSVWQVWGRTTQKAMWSEYQETNKDLLPHYADKKSAASYLMDPGGRGAKETARLHQVLTFRMRRAYISTRHMFMAWRLIKHRESFLILYSHLYLHFSFGLFHRRFMTKYPYVSLLGPFICIYLLMAYLTTLSVSHNIWTEWRKEAVVA